MAENIYSLQGNIPSGYKKPADPVFTTRTEGDIPISEAERIIRENQERMKAVTGPIGKVLRSLSQVYVNPLLPKSLEIDTNEEAEAKRNAEMQKAKIWREKRDSVKKDVVGILASSTDMYEKTGNEEVLHYGKETIEKLLKESNLSYYDLNPQISPAAYILRDDAGLWTSSPNPYPMVEYVSEALGGLFGMSKGYSFGEALLTKDFIKNLSKDITTTPVSRKGFTTPKKLTKGVASGFMRMKGPWWAKVGGAVVGGAAAVGAADFGYELMLDLMNAAGKAKDTYKSKPGYVEEDGLDVLKRKVASVVPEALTFGPRGINRPKFDERWESVKKDAILDATISSAFFGARPLYYGIKTGFGRGVFGMGKKGPGAGAIDPEQLIEEEMKLMQKFGGDDLMKQVSQMEQLNIPMIGGPLTNLLRSRFANVLGPAVNSNAFVQGTGLGKHHISAAGSVGGVEPMLGRIPWIGKWIKQHLGERGALYGKLSDNMLGRFLPYNSVDELNGAYRVLAQKKFKWFQDEAYRLEQNILESGNSYGDIISNQEVRKMAQSILGRMESTWMRDAKGALIKPNATNARWVKLLKNIIAGEKNMNVRKMYGLRREMDDYLGKKGLGSVASDPASLVDPVTKAKYGIEGSTDDVLDLMKAWDTDIARLGSEYEAPEVVKALTAYDRFINNGALIWGSDAGAVAGKVSKYGYKLAIDHDSTRAAHSLFTTAMKSGDVDAIRRIKNIVGDEAYYRGVGTYIRDIFEKNIDEVEGIMKPNYKGIRDALGISRRAEELGVKPFWDEALKKSTAPVTLINGKEFNETLFKGAIPAGAMRSVELRKLPELNDFRALLDVMERVFKNGIPSMSVFMARRATIGGVRAGLNAALPTQVLGTGMRTGAGTAGALSLIGGQWFWPLMGAFTLRYGGKIMTNPVNMRVYRNAIDTNLPETVRALNLARFFTLMPDEWESFDQDLAELEGAQKQLAKTNANKSMVDKWSNRTTDYAERLINSAYDFGKGMISGDTPIPFTNKTIPQALEPTNVPFSYLKSDEPEIQQPVYADEAEGADTPGYGSATGSSIFNNPTMNPGAAGNLYAGGLDAALAAQYGGQKDGGMIEPLNAPRRMDKKGIISLVS